MDFPVLSGLRADPCAECGRYDCVPVHRSEEQRLEVSRALIDFQMEVNDAKQEYEAQRCVAQGAYVKEPQAWASSCTHNLVVSMTLKIRLTKLYSSDVRKMCWEETPLMVACNPYPC